MLSPSGINMFHLQRHDIGYRPVNRCENNVCIFCKDGKTRGNQLSAVTLTHWRSPPQESLTPAVKPGRPQVLHATGRIPYPATNISLHGDWVLCLERVIYSLDFDIKEATLKWQHTFCTLSFPLVNTFIKTAKEVISLHSFSF